ncbi:MAG: hypothetical protein QOH43_2165 [Solirubrobacteraceae bacterium]|jgi:hypothetical protein|nr:hypothetical protein [Solirubrobacteraceae bacterium]
MTTKADFNAEEWDIVAQAPLLAGMSVVAASRGGTLRESMAMAKTYAEARKQQGASELLDALVASPPAVDPSHLQQGDDMAKVVTERLREAVRLMEQKATPEEVGAYKRFILDVAEAAAKAHKEGGFLGVGGKEVSEEEQRALDQVAATLTVSPA